MKQKRDREEACPTCSHYHDYENGEPCGVCGHVMVGAGNRTQHESVMPTTIVPGFLYLGTYDTASRQDLLKAMNITHILNTVPNCQALYKNTFTYHTVSSSPPEFEECFHFLDSVHTQESRVLVYCMSGITRSATVVIGYMMKLRGWRLQEAYKWVKDKRRNIQISEGDTKRLIELEMRMHGSCSVPLGFAALAMPALGEGVCQSPAPGSQPYGVASAVSGVPGGQGPQPAHLLQPFCFSSAPVFTMGAAPAGTMVFGQGLQENGAEMET